MCEPITIGLGFAFDWMKKWHEFFKPTSNEVKISYFDTQVKELFRIALGSLFGVVYPLSLFLQLYIHRSGRTARACREGLSVVLVGPEELGSYRKIMKTLNGGIL